MRASQREHSDSAMQIHDHYHMNETIPDLRRTMMADIFDPDARLRRGYQVPL